MTSITQCPERILAPKLHDPLSPSVSTGQGGSVAPVSESAIFTPAYVVRLAQDAAMSAGLASDPAELIRVGTNAVLRLPCGVVARVARDMSSMDSIGREVVIARALTAAGIPSAEPLQLDQPIAVQGHPITFWAEIKQGRHEPTVADLGRILCQIHRAELDLAVPEFDPWGHTPDRIEQVPISERERTILRAALRRLQDSYARVAFDLQPGLIHGDAWVGNLIADIDGTVAILDFDSVATGAREWDLVPTALYVTSLGWLSRTEYQSFVDAYGGFDVTSMPGYATLAGIRELRMTVWLAQHAEESERVAAEVAHRVDCIADPALPRHWSAR
jgi:aminoglycoside phosphotransferase (APT) family kinase protein